MGSNPASAFAVFQNGRQRARRPRCWRRRGRWTGLDAGWRGWVSGHEPLLLPGGSCCPSFQGLSALLILRHRTEDHLEGVGGVRLLDIQILSIFFHLLRVTRWRQECPRPVLCGTPRPPTHITAPTLTQCEGQKGSGSTIEEPDPCGPCPFQVPSRPQMGTQSQPPCGLLPSIKAFRGHLPTWPNGGCLPLPRTRFSASSPHIPHPPAPPWLRGS